jgi:hypothetical protein
MWIIKTFISEAKMEEWIRKNKSKYQIEEVFVNNGYAVEYRKLRIF